MLPLPRVAVGAIQPETDLRAILWALMEAFRSRGVQVQRFLSRACFATCHGPDVASGLTPRHLDSWLMSPDVCREILIRGAESCDLAVVHGTFAHAATNGRGPTNGRAPTNENGIGGSLETLCEWLNLPRLLVLDVSRFSVDWRDGDDRLPERPQQVDALLLDGVADSRQLARLTAQLEARWRVPVLGALEALPELRSEMEGLPSGSRPPRELCRQLGNHFLRHARPQRILELGFQREFDWGRTTLPAFHGACSQITVALAYDDALDCYFPDTLDLLEARGAKIVDFSPLRDERLPEGTDIVYLGCGHPERYAAELSHNHCMKLALRNHLCIGGRIYAEGGGLAYLCQQIEIAAGRREMPQRFRMAGIFPAIAMLRPTDGISTPTEVTLDQPTWLAGPGERLRGYYNPGWELKPAGALVGCVREPELRYAVVRSCRAIGSQIHLNFAAQPNVLPGFFRPDPPRVEMVDPWTTVA